MLSLCLSADRLSTCDVRQITPPRIVSAVIWKRPLFHSICPLRDRTHRATRPAHTERVLCRYFKASFLRMYSRCGGRLLLVDFRTWCFKCSLIVPQYAVHFVLFGRSLRRASRYPVGLCTECKVTLAHPLNATWIPNCLQTLALKPSLVPKFHFIPVFLHLDCLNGSHPSRAWQAFAFPKEYSFSRYNIIVTCGPHF
jgi:hypothetical protein